MTKLQVGLVLQTQRESGGGETEKLIQLDMGTLLEISNRYGNASFGHNIIQLSHSRYGFDTWESLLPNYENKSDWEM